MAATHTGRVAINSTFGLLGAMDLATPVGLERQREDFGLTLGTWGFESGAYLVLPLLGPSSVRDAAGLSVDFATDPVLRLRDHHVRDAAVGLRMENQRSKILGVEKTLQSIELDPDVFMRATYLARRRSAVNDDDPPAPKEKGLHWKADYQMSTHALNAQELSVLQRVLKPLLPRTLRSKNVQAGVVPQARRVYSKGIS